MIFFIITSILMLLILLYIGRSITAPFSLTKNQLSLILVLLFLTPVLFVFSFVLRSNPGLELVSSLLGWTGYILFGFFSVVLVFVIIKDLLRLFQKAGDKIKSNKIDHNTGFDPEKRKFLKQSISYGILGASGIITGYGIYQARRNPLLEQLDIHIDNLPASLEGFKIAQFTDLHVGPTIKRNFVESVVNQVQQLDADVIVFTGDLVDGTVSGLREHVEPIRDLDAPYGKYFVTGNHEYYSNAVSWVKEAEKLGFNVLLNTHDVINHNNERLVMAGITDFSADRFVKEHKSDPAKALKDAPESAVKILLAHQPRSIYEAAQYDFDLQLSGHTHGGQYIPWNALVTLNQPFLKGLNKYKNTQIYISRGTGYWGPPLRIGVPSEVTLIRLTGTASVT